MAARLVKANLDGADLSGANLIRTDLTEAALIGTRLRGTKLLRANLTKAVFADADLLGANLEDADLSGALLCDVDLTEANLSKAKLVGASIVFETYLTGTNLSGADLTDIHGLTQEVLNQAHGDGETRLPDGMKRPAEWGN